METVYFLLGSNLGDRRENLIRARQEISRSIGPVITTSSIYKTAAWGKTDQPDFYNQIIVVETDFHPLQALAHVQKIEKDMGRDRIEKWGARLIDIDLLFWGDKIINNTSLTIPHPGIPFRRFTLVPLNEINKRLIHPVMQITVAELLEACRDDLSVEKLEDITGS